MFGPGLPGAGKSVVTWFESDSLHVDGHGAVHVSQISVQAGGFSTESLTIEWSVDQQGYALIVEDVAVAQQFLDTAPHAVSEHSNRYRTAVSRGRRVWQAAGALAAALVIAAGLLWWYYDESVAWVASQVPPETEARIGQSGLAQFSTTYELMPESEYQEAVEVIGQELITGSVYTYQWHVADTDEINAFAMPGGVIVVFRGLIDEADSPEELAGVIAHEVQHVEKQHVLQGMIHSLGWATLLAVVMGDASALATILAFEAGSTYFSRELESIADQEGVRALHEVGIDPSGMASFFETLIESHGDSSATFLSTHPSSGERIREIEALIAELPPKVYRDVPVDWSALLALRTEKGSE